jgi:hypothetical protein
VAKARITQAVRKAKGDQLAQLIDHLKKTEMAKETAHGCWMAPAGCGSRCVSPGPSAAADPHEDGPRAIAAE